MIMRPSLRFSLLAIALTACAATPTPTPTLAPAPAPTPTPAAAAPAEGQLLVLDPLRSSVRYAADETLLNEDNRVAVALGQTSVITGQITLNRAAPAQSAIGVFAVNLSTLTSDSARRDEALRTQWLESARYPVATFVARGLANFPDQPQEDQPVQFQLLGDLTVKQTTRAVTWDVTATLHNEMIAGQAQTRLRLTEFGVEPPAIAGILTVKDEVQVTLEFTLLPTQ